MSQTGNKNANTNTNGANDAKNILNALADTANQVTSFLNGIQDKLTPEQKEMLDNELGGNGEFHKKMKKTQEDLSKVMVDLNNLNKK
jgi:small-conductance mechanosensitive channel